MQCLFVRILKARSPETISRQTSSTVLEIGMGLGVSMKVIWASCLQTLARVPHGGVNAVRVFLEATNRGWPIERPELDRVIPGGGDEGVAADGVVVDELDLASVLVEGADRVGSGGKREVVDLERAVGYGGDEERVVGLGPGDVVDAIGGVEGGDLYERGGRSGREVEDVEAAVAKDAEVLGGGYGEYPLNGVLKTGMVVAVEDWGV